MSKSSSTGGSPTGGSPTGSPPETPAETAVRDYLRRNPDFLAHNPDLAAVLIPATSRFGDNVVDMQRFVLERLRTQVDHLTSSQGELIAATRSNMASQSQVHEAVLAIVDADSPEHFAHVVTQEFRDILDIDVVALCVERRDGLAAGFESGGAVILDAGAASGLLGGERALLLHSDNAGNAAVYGAAADLVRSDALVRLDTGPGKTVGLLAFGSRETDRFHPGQGTELLSFLGQTVGRCLRRWLETPAS